MTSRSLISLNSYGDMKAFFAREPSEPAVPDSAASPKQHSSNSSVGGKLDRVITAS